MNLRRLHAVAIALIASASLLNQTRADTLNLGGSTGAGVVIVGASVGVGIIASAGGDFAGSTLNGNALPWVYCVDVLHGVNPHHSPFAATVSHDGKVNGNAVNNADEIAYVLLHYGAAATNAGLQGAVQAAVWNLEYGGTILAIGGDNIHGHLKGLANGYVNEAQHAHTAGLASQLSWLTLDDTHNNNTIQGLVTITAVPEPSTFAIAALAGLGMLTYARRRRSR